jgi:hypothetical protein
LIRGCFERELLALEHQPGPAAAENVLGFRGKGFFELGDIAELLDQGLREF